jgi:hypothetical protein
METSQILFSVVSVLYVVFLTRSLINQKIELYDALHLTTIIAIVSIFILLPEIGERISKTINVKFPFVIMFSLILIEVYYFLHRMVIRMHKQDLAIRKLTQEIALLKVENTQR